ncbi:MAG: TonB-dependent receptor [Gracilimonas sp.]|uniref:TonB-dependent receptor plug domain-containing protein n=1 Tax=Gracilimonas TaxID=649462 RepID=UPI001B0AE834|nr:TonB-dependent receptor [Gracilimonas sp.]MBO6587049.1 TonB-dependent receptor [Gracilimonas sp.]MBO6614463.1 TonB-dependent receptor [Gracilimonas sp.]
MKHLITLITLFLLAVSNYTYAQVADTLDLGEVVVTASKTPTTDRETTKPVTVIEREEIERHTGLSISELLNQQNGITINGAASSPGKDKSVYLRGASTQFTLILIDGFPVTDPSGEGGAFDLRLLPLENVERIEIVKGSMSTLYGSDAIAGVINIITKKSETGTFNVNGKASYGSFNTYDWELGASGSSDIIDYTVNVTRTQTDGISEAEPRDGADFKKDGYERNAINTQVSVKPVEGLTLTPFLNYSQYDGDYDAGAFSDADNRYEANLLNTGARISYKGDNFEIKEAATFTQTGRKFTDGFGVFNPEASLFNSDLYGIYNKFEKVRLLAGFNVQSLNFQLEGIDEGSQILSPYVTAFLRSGFGLNGELGLRLNNHSEYGSNWTFNVAPVYNITEEIKLLASVSSGFKAPTLNELFGPFGANTELKPQQSLTVDTGVELQLLDGRLSASAIYFRRTIEDLISYSGNQGYINVNEQNDSGIELSVGYKLDQTKVEVFYNYLDGAITQNGEETDNLIRRPDHNFGVNLNQQLTSNFSVSLSGQYVGERNDLYFNTNTFSTEEVELESYVLINANIQYQLLDEQLAVFASLNNLLNADYTEVYGFNTPGFHFKGGVKFLF